MATAQWLKEHTTLFSFRINNDTGLPEKIKQAVATDYNGSISKFLVAAVTAFLDHGSNPVSNPCHTAVSNPGSNPVSNPVVNTDGSTDSAVSNPVSNAVSNPGSNPVSNPVSNPGSNPGSNTQPAVPTYIPTDPLDIVAEAFYHQPYATLSFHGRGCCDFIADHPIMGPEMVLDAPPEYIKAGIEYMNNPTPVPIYQPKPSENNSKLTEIINTVNSYRAAKDEAFRQSLVEAETLYPDDGDGFFCCDSDDEVSEEIQESSEEFSE